MLFAGRRFCRPNQDDRNFFELGKAKYLNLIAAFAAWRTGYGSRFTVWNVFTTGALAGNPLAVVTGAEGLTAPEMQAIARQFNISETVFVLPAASPAHSARIRNFTPSSELPFAGHPTVGAAIQLAQDKIGDAGGDLDAIIVLEEEIGIVRVGVMGRPGHMPYAEFDVPRTPKAFGAPAETEYIAAALGLTPAEVGFANHTPSQFDAGVPCAFVPVRDLEVIARASVNIGEWNAAFAQSGGRVFGYCKSTIRHDAAFHARFFAPMDAIMEDPATGSAVAAFAAVIHRFDRPPEGASEFLIEQGVEMRRPSEIKLEIDVSSGDIRRVRIGGHARKVMDGVLMV